MNPEDDVMRVITFAQTEARRLFLKVLNIDMNRFKSIWSLMLGI